MSVRGAVERGRQIVEPAPSGEDSGPGERWWLVTRQYEQRKGFTG